MSQVSISKGDELRVTNQGQIVTARRGQAIPEGALPDGTRLVFFGCPEIVRTRFPNLGERPEGVYRAGETPAVEFNSQRFALEHMPYAEMRILDLGVILQGRQSFLDGIPVDVDD